MVKKDIVLRFGDTCARAQGRKTEPACTEKLLLAIHNSNVLVSVLSRRVFVAFFSSLARSTVGPYFGSLRLEKTFSLILGRDARGKKKWSNLRACERSKRATEKERRTVA